MRELAAYLKRNIQIAVKSVRFNYKKYLPFFAAVFIIQIFFGALLFSGDQASEKEKQIIDRDYSYHAVYRALNDQQYVYLLKYAKSDANRSAIFEIVETRELAGYALNDTHTDVFIVFLGEDPVSTYRDFKGRFHTTLSAYADEGTSLGYSLTPLLDNDGSSVRSGTTLYCFLLVLLSIVLLTLLYTVRINNYKFEYGIYMAFGADFRKLSENAFFEMLIITLLPYLPAVGISFLATYLIHGTAIFRIGTALLVLLLSLLCSVASVFFPMFVVSKIYPMKHILAEDNSNYVSSPRVSFEMLGKSLKRHYVPFSLFRFRKYFAKIILTATAFTILSSAVFFVSGLMTERENTVKPQFRLSFSGSVITYDADLSEQLHSFDGVAYTDKSCNEIAIDINSHLAFTDGQVASFANFVVPNRSSDDFPYANDSARYYACDSELIRYLENFTYEGDLNALLTTENGVILSENIQNHKKLTLEPGDKIYAAIPVGYNEDSTTTLGELAMLQGKKLFKGRLEVYNYEYIELTVVAVIKDMPTGEYLPVYLSESTYRSLVYPDDVLGTTEITYNPVAVYTDPGMTENEISNLESRLKEWANIYGTVTVTNLQANGNAQILRAMNIPELCIIVAILITLLSPLIWFFSQIIFYRKRYPEMDILRALGAVSGEIKHLFLMDGIYTAVLSAALTAGLSAVMFRAVHYAANSLSGTACYYTFSFPAAVYAAAILLSALYAFFSVYVSYRSYIKSHAGDTDIFLGE